MGESATGPGRGFDERIVDGEESISIWDRQKERTPGFVRYEAGASRQVPAVLLEPVTSAG